MLFKQTPADRDFVGGNPRTGGPAYNKPLFETDDHDDGPSVKVFQTVEEAISRADKVVYLEDFSFPEKTGHGLFVHRHNQAHTLDAPGITIQMDLIQICVESLIDMRDYSETTGQLVLDGKGFFVCKPSVPYYQLYNSKQMFKMFGNLPERIEQNHSKWCTKVLGDETRKFNNILVLFPKGVRACLDFHSPAPVIARDDEKATLKLAELPLSFDGASQNNPTAVVHQLFVPGYWMTRVVGTKQKRKSNTVFKNHKNRKDDIADALGGEPAKTWY